MEKTVIIVPTYWKKGNICREDHLYDHPTDLLGKDETLLRTLDSFNVINADFDVLIIGIPTRDEIGNEMDEYLLKILTTRHYRFTLYYFGYADFLKLQGQIRKTIEDRYWNILSNKGYGNVRNLCIFLAHVMGYSISILIDDDEIITDRSFINKIMEGFMRFAENEHHVGLILGYYLNKDQSILLPEEDIPPWMIYWNKNKLMNKAFQLILDSNTRYINSPFALGGNMAIHRKCWIKVPFDPLIPRGEDMDYLRNCIYFGFRPFLDTKLSVVHLPNKCEDETDHKFKQDVFRFIYSRHKLKSMSIPIDQFDPYPGYFLRNTEGKAYLTELLRSIFNNPEKFITIKNPLEFNKLMEKEEFITTAAIKFAKQNSTFYLQFQLKWVSFMKLIDSLKWYVHLSKV